MGVGRLLESANGKLAEWVRPFICSCAISVVNNHLQQHTTHYGLSVSGFVYLQMIIPYFNQENFDNGHFVNNA